MIPVRIGVLLLVLAPLDSRKLDFRPIPLLRELTALDDMRGGDCVAVLSADRMRDALVRTSLLVAGAVDDEG